MRTVFVRLTLSALLIIVIVYYLTRHSDLHQIGLSLTEVSPFFVIAAIVLTALSHIVRAVRWITLMRVDYTRFMADSVAATFVGYAVNTLIPRGGEVVRPLLFAARTEVAAAPVVASLLVERALDVLLLLLACFVLLVFQGGYLAESFPWLFTVNTAFYLLISVAIALVIFFFALAGRPRKEANRSIRGKRLSRLWDFVYSTRIAMRESLLGNNFIRICIESVVIWSLYVLVVCFVNISLPFKHAPIGIVDAVTVLLIISIGVTIAPTPGALGVYQVFAQAAAIGILGYDSDQALAFGVLAWVINYGTALLGGAASLLWVASRGVNLRQLFHRLKKRNS